MQCSSDIPVSHAELLGRAEPHVCPDILGRRDHLLQDREEQLVHLRAMLERFMEHGLKLKPSKCNFFRTEISYLGHKVSVAGMEPGTDGLKGITKIAPPATYTQVRKFLGVTGYFWRFIKGYARIAKPLKDLLQGENSKLKSHPVGLPPDTLVAFQELKMKYLTVPVLAFADSRSPSCLRQMPR